MSPARSSSSISSINPCTCGPPSACGGGGMHRLASSAAHTLTLACLPPTPRKHPTPPLEAANFVTTNFLRVLNTKIPTQLPDFSHSKGESHTQAGPCGSLGRAPPAELRGGAALARALARCRLPYSQPGGQKNPASTQGTRVCAGAAAAAACTQEPPACAVPAAVAADHAVPPPLRPETRLFAENVRKALCETFVRLDNEWANYRHHSGACERWVGCRAQRQQRQRSCAHDCSDPPPASSPCSHAPCC